MNTAHSGTSLATGRRSGASGRNQPPVLPLNDDESEEMKALKTYAASATEIRKQLTVSVPPDDPKKQRKELPLHEGESVLFRRYVGPKRQNKKAIEVFVQPEIRQSIKALALTKKMGAQEYIERLIVKEVEKKHDLVEKGLELLEQNVKKPHRTKVQILEEENERLRKVEEENELLKRQLGSRSKPRHHR